MAQVRHPVALDHPVRILQEKRRPRRAEVPPARAEHRRHDVHRHLFHQAEREGLPADVTRRHDDGAVPGRLPGRGDRPGHVVDEVVRRPGGPALGLRPVRHHDDVPARRR
ncbi:hypothetical protein BM536_017180 [Streptomyces phaeoluteigriseus]|uniref:Uncharacterized protein n=1 Tax=Streptomyces phaeoluteigriseus TaxID=114686 RepID=A0A1V6MRX1_9ACTN|nr:hypothetical protein BM536_017180 [Streptomyces phaeoluteigriseus]